MLTDQDYELLSAYIDGALTQSERAAFETRLQSEPELRRELDELRATVTLLNNLPVRKAPRDFTLDAHYARRSSFFFTSATFSALSTAAAIILFAFGAYLFSGNKPAPLAASSEQIAQSAFASTPTASALDKSAAVTATVLESLKTSASTNTIENSPVAAAGLATNGDLAQESSPVEPPQLTDQLPLIQTNITQPTNRPDDATTNSAAIDGSVAANSQRTGEATQALTLQQYAAPSSSNSTGGSVAPAPMQETAANAGSAILATQLPPSTATLEPTSMPTLTATPSLTATATSTPQPTATVTLAPTTAPLPPAAPIPNGADYLPVLLIALGVLLLIVSIITTIIRRRNRL